MLTIEAILKQHRFFEGMDAQQIELLVTCAHYARYDTGDPLIRAGEPADAFFVIGPGRVAIELPIPARPVLPIQTLGEGDVLGWSWLYPPHKWQFGARALEPTKAIVFDATKLRARCESDHELGYELMKRFANVMTQRLTATRLQLLDVYAVGPL